MLSIRSGKPVRTKGWPTWPVYDDREIKALEEALKSGTWGGGVSESGPKEGEFEEKFASYHGCKYGICVSCGNAALYISLLANGIGSGDEVIVPDLTFWAGTGSPILMVGATPIIVDVDPETYCLDVEKLEESKR